MNWRKTSSLLAVLPLAFLCANAMAQDKPDAVAIRIYDASELTLDRYTIVKRIWTGTWRASLWVPGHREREAAIEALKAQAAHAGADGVVNLHCLSDPGWNGEYFCYGLAIRLKQPAATHGSRQHGQARLSRSWRVSSP
jgi:uncharacterized protein YbjQ (UPF0145 family)